MILPSLARATQVLAMTILVALAAPAPVRAQSQPGDDHRCWVAIRISGPEPMRVNDKEAEQRLRLRCRAGDALVFLTDLGQPMGGIVARYCDMARPIIVEQTEHQRPLARGEDVGTTATIHMATCTYRGSPRLDR